jgi:hypothetical protein
VSTTFTVTLSPDDYLAANRLMFWVDRRRPKRLIFWTIVWGALAIFGLYMSWADSHAILTVTFWLKALSPVFFGLGFVFLFDLAFYFSLPFQTRKAFLANKFMQLPATYRIESDGLEIKDQFGASKIPYAMFQSWECNRDLLAISAVEGVIHILPARSSSVEALEELKNKLQEANVPTNTKAKNS